MTLSSVSVSCAMPSICIRARKQRQHSGVSKCLVPLRKVRKDCVTRYSMYTNNVNLSNVQINLKTAQT